MFSYPAQRTAGRPDHRAVYWPDGSDEPVGMHLHAVPIVPGLDPVRMRGADGEPTRAAEFFDCVGSRYGLTDPTKHRGSVFVVGAEHQRDTRWTQTITSLGKKVARSRISAGGDKELYAIVRTDTFDVIDNVPGVTMVAIRRACDQQVNRYQFGEHPLPGLAYQQSTTCGHLPRKLVGLVGEWSEEPGRAQAFIFPYANDSFVGHRLVTPAGYGSYPPVLRHFFAEQLYHFAVVLIRRGNPDIRR